MDNKTTSEDIKQLYRQLTDDYRRAEETFNAGLKALREKCDHKDSRFVPDASGNNDSGYFCNSCKLWW